MCQSWYFVRSESTIKVNNNIRLLKIDKLQLNIEMVQKEL